MLRVRNFETSEPTVIDSAKAMFEVNDYVRHVAMQRESALRAMASSHPFSAFSAPRSCS
jgi:hypothetical protein